MQNCLIILSSFCLFGQHGNNLIKAVEYLEWKEGVRTEGQDFSLCGPRLPDACKLAWILVHASHSLNPILLFSS